VLRQLSEGIGDADSDVVTEYSSLSAVISQPISPVSTFLQLISRARVMYPFVSQILPKKNPRYKIS
jgi:hypothetical protein